MKPPRTHRQSASTSGLTLIELLVVLTLIALTSTIALRSVSNRVLDNQYDVNIELLEDIEQAILGTEDLEGFVGDIGRLPLAQGNDAETQLAELWEQGSLPAYTITSPSGDPTIRMGTGWRGPYLVLGVNQDRLLDGFSNSFLFFENDGSPAGNGDRIEIIQSAGANGTVASSDTNFEQDLEILFEADEDALGTDTPDEDTNNWEHTFTVTVEGSPLELPADNTIIVRVYGPDGNGNIHTVQQAAPQTATSLTPSLTFTFTDIPVGHKIVKAYQTSTASPGAQDTISSARESAARRIRVHSRMVDPTLEVF